MTYGKESTEKFKQLIVATQKALEKFRKTGDNQDWQGYLEKHNLLLKERDRLANHIQHGG